MSEWCPYQAVFCLYHSRRRPQYEPLRALPLPDNTYAAISRHPRYMHVSPTFSRRIDTQEWNMIRSLDAAGMLDEYTRAGHKALQALSSEEQEIVSRLMAYQQDQQFDFDATALAYVLREEKTGPPYDDRIRKAKQRERDNLLQAWSSIKQKTVAVLGSLNSLSKEFS